MTSISGINIEDMAQWGEPQPDDDGRLVRYARPSKLWRVLHQSRPADLRAAGIFFRREGETSYLIQYLDRRPEPRVLREAAIPPPPASLKVNEAGLLAWQPDPLKRLVSFWKAGRIATADFSDTGVGKTYVGLAFARELNRHVFVVTLKSALHQWKEAAKAMNVDCSVANYEWLKTGKHPAMQWETKGDSRWPLWRVDGRKCLVIFDEAQRCKSPDFTLDSKMLLMARYQEIPVHIMSATIATSPVFMRAAGYALGLHNNENFDQWLENHGCFQRGNDWLFANDPEILRALHERMFQTCAVRVRKNDLGDLFPETLIEPVLVEVDGIDSVYADLKRAYAELNAKAASYQDSKYGYLTAARQRAEYLKVPVVVEMAKEAMEEGRSVALFFNFDTPLKLAMKMLGHPESVITGQTPSAERHRLQGLFQSDRLQVLGLNVESGGAAISLHGERERSAFIMPTWRADTLKQVFGRVHRAKGSRSTQRVLFAAETIEEDICLNVRAKLNNLDLLNDGDTQGNLLFAHERE
jgi:hypothetical protein